MGSRHRTRAVGVLGNVWRSLVSASPWVWAWVLPVTIAAAVASVADARTVDSIVRADEQARQRGDHLLVLSGAGLIDPRSCDALSGSSGARAAGAWRQLDTIRLAVLPDDAIGVIEVTAGLLPLIDITADPPAKVLTGAGLSTRLGSARQLRPISSDISFSNRQVDASPQASSPPLIEVDGVAEGTGVLSPLDRSFLTVGLPTGSFDSCAVSFDRLTERDVEVTLVALARAPSIDNLTVGTASGLPIDRIVDPNLELSDRSTARLPLATAGMAFLMGIFVSFFRRKEFIVLAISGWSRTARLLQILAECIVLSVVPVAATVVITRVAVPDLDATTTTTLALRTGLLAAAAACLGSILPVIGHRPQATLTAMRE